jgi:hypothetical protein
MSSNTYAIYMGSGVGYTQTRWLGQQRKFNVLHILCIAFPIIKHISIYLLLPLNIINLGFKKKFK